MSKAFLAFASMIITGFVIKSYKKFKEKPATKEELYRTMKAEALRRNRDLNGHIREKYLSDLPPSKDLMDSMAMASDGCAMMGVAR